MAHGHHVLLLWFNISGFRVPPILLVCVVYLFSKRMVKVLFFVACDTAECSKNRLLRIRKLIISGSFSYPP